MFHETQLFLCFKHIPAGIAANGVYFLRKSWEPIIVPTSPSDASSTLPKLFETGTISPNPLNELEKLLKHIYTPLLMASGQKSKTDVSQADEKDEEEDEEEEVVTAGRVRERRQRAVPGRSLTQSKMMLRDEMLINVQKFASHLHQTIQQVEGEVKLVVPTIDVTDPVEAARDSALVSQLEGVVEDWGRQITSTVEEQQKKTPQGNGPLAEVDFWKEKNTALSALYEQLQVPAVHTILAVLHAAGSPFPSTFEISRSDLNKVYVEAKDNVKFLGTLERHFKNITHGASFGVVLDTIPAMMNALRMVWVISRHYNTDERMIPLMERIAWEVCERAARVVDIRTIFK